MGKLEKMRIEAFSGPELRDDQVVGTFYALVNPDSYSVETKMETQQGQGQGTSARQQRFTMKLPEEFSFEFLFDNTGIIDGKPNAAGITDDLNKLKDLLIKYDGSIHEPRHLRLTWGTFLFRGRMTSMNVQYKLFNPDGSPIRAMVKVTIKQSEEENRRAATEDRRSPDLTHIRVVKRGDTLPWLCYKVYGDPKYYVQVAKVNGIVNFRKLREGTEIYFPPIAKKIS
ncbi:MAG TPA: tail protein X [Chitinophagaceae bacterium]|nr:tail protein X [Chitinophagaceae bacterium]